MKKLIRLILVFVLFWGQGLQAQKVISAYAGFTATDIKNRADIPLQSNMTVSGSNVNCVNITTTQVKNVLGETVTGVGALCSSPLVNKWSGFGPTEWYVNAGSFLNRIKTPYSMGSFAGYNHDAVPAGWMSTNESSKPTTFEYNTSESTKILSGALQGGEINFPAMVGATHVKWVVKEGTNTVGSNIVSLNYWYNSYPIIPVVTINITGSGNKSYTSNLYLSNVAGDELCNYPNTAEWTISTRQQLPATAGISCIAPLGFSEGTVSLDISFQQFTLNLSVVHKGNAYGFAVYNGRVNITAKVYNKQGTLAHTQVITTADYARSYTGTINGYDVVYDNSVVFEVSNSDPL